MRTRKEIEDDFYESVGAKERGTHRIRRELILLEIFLDIRDLLTPKGPRAVFPESAPPPKVT